LWAGTKGVPIGEPKSLGLKNFSLAVFFLERYAIIYPLKTLNANLAQPKQVLLSRFTLALRVRWAHQSELHKPSYNN
jgi:hypothetical protein